MNNNAILIVDDMEINRTILAECFKNEYQILEAADGVQAIDIIDSHENIAAVLLDLIMPKMNGLDVLRKINENGKSALFPVFIITAAESDQMLMDAYELGASDIISKPFRINFLKCRVNSLIELYRHRNELEAVVTEQVERLSRINESMVETLATIIEFRDCESGEHVKRIVGLTDILLTALSDSYPEYYLPRSEISKIVMSSTLHDVGKISIPDGILNKPGRLTKEEFEIMKQHTVKGCEILANMPEDIMDRDVYKYSYDICRHHHERWDGRGYPDGLKGDDIPIWAQVVAVADVYDALTSPRVYKSAFDHDTAVKMIFDGECGTFNPKILDVFKRSLDKIIKRSTNTGYIREKKL